jgi:DNA (cytosine-5)-methyltransferase 1
MTVLNLFSGPGGWCTGARTLGLGDYVGIEYDAAACATRAAAGHGTIRADVAAFPVAQVAGRVTGLVASPPCTTFSAAGHRAGNAVTDALDDLIRDLFAGNDTRSQRRREMGRVLHAATPMLPTLGRRAHRIAAAVRSAALVAEPARYIAATNPEWIAMEQVPSVLPLWQVYAAELRAMGYSVWSGVLNAADYGVPQTRQRAILIASRVRRVGRPEPTHYDPRKGDQLFGLRWVTMAEALGWAATDRPAPTVTAGGTKTGGAEPFGHRDRDALAAERDSGRWVLRRERSAARAAHDATRDRPLSATAPTVSGGGQGRMSWALRIDTQAKATKPRSVTEPAPTLMFGHRANLVAWVTERPATTVQCDPRIGHPGHKDRKGGESQFAQGSVRITPAEAAALQSVPPGYPFQGSKTQQFRQIGDAVPPLLAARVLAEAAGITVKELAA